MNYSFKNKKFKLVNNSKRGSATKTTSFIFQQKGKMVTAEYKGGGIKDGKIIARLEGKYLFMLYHCYTNLKELKSGKALAVISQNENKKMVLDLDWEWLHGEKGKGKSQYVEI